MLSYLHGFEISPIIYK